jgi:sugar lactone lactonase YvrE
MRALQLALAPAILAIATLIAQAQTGACVNDAPNPYHLVNDWAHFSRPLAPTNNVYVDAKDNVWVFDRCGDRGCAGSDASPIWEIAPDGHVLKNFGARLFVFPHQVVADSDGNVWLVDNQPAEGKGMQVTKLSPDGRVLMTLGKAGQGGKGLDVFDRPNSVAIAPNGDIFVAEGHAPDFGNSRIVKFDRNGKFITAFGHLGSGDGEFRSPHVIMFDSRGRLFAADRSNSRVDIYDQDGKFLAAWKQFGRPSGLWIDNNDTLYVTDSESEDAPGNDHNNPGCKRGMRVGSARTGKVDYYIPPPPVSDPKIPPPEGVAADSHGTIYAAAVQARTVYKYVKN